MQQDESFWKEASRKIDDLFRNPIKLNNEDLLIDIPDSPNKVTASPSRPKFKIKSSELNKKYTNYKPEIISILKESKKLARVDHKTNRTPSPTFHYKNKKKTLTNQFETSLEVCGQKAGFFTLPKIVNPGKLKNFIQRVKEKYESLYKLLKDCDGNIRAGGLMSFLNRVMEQKKCSPFIRLSSQSEHVMKRSKNLLPVRDYTNLIQEQGQMLMKLFDPFSEGIISAFNFFGVLSIYEYSCVGLDGKSRFDISSSKHVRYLSIQVGQLKGLFVNYKQSNILDREYLIKLFEKVKGLDNCTDEIFHEISLKKSANFGQFLSIIPIFLENYDDIMVNLD